MTMPHNLEIQKDFKIQFEFYIIFESCQVMVSGKSRSLGLQIPMGGEYHVGEHSP
jgi:hypothetical protein